jgi:hypothetical protein
VLEPSAERVAVDRGNDRLRAVVEHVGAAARGLRPRLAELPDVRAGDKAAPRADQHHGADIGIGIAALDAFDDPFAHTGSQRVHRRIVDGDHTDAVLDFESHHVRFAHFTPLRFSSHERLTPIGVTGFLRSVSACRALRALR